MSIPNFNEAKARTGFSPSAWNQGETYLANDAVTPGTVQHSHRGFELTADVRRSAHRSYRVTIVCDEAGACQGECTCPFETRGGCPHCAAVIMLWCRRPSQFLGYVTLSALGFANAREQGTTATQVGTTLAEADGGTVPPAVIQPIDRGTVATDNLHLYDNLCVIEFADDFILPELLRVSGLPHYLLHIFSPRVVAVQPKQVSALVADLEARGYMPRVEPV